MPANPFSTNDPIPSAVGPLSGEAHGDIDAVTTVINQQINPDGMYTGANVREAVSKANTAVQPGVPAYQKSPVFREGRC